MAEIILYPSGLDTELSSYAGINSSYPISALVGKGSDTTGYGAGVQLNNGVNTTTNAYVTFDTSEIPQNAVIDSVVCKVSMYAHSNTTNRTGERTAQMTKLSNKVGSAVNWTGTQVLTLSDTGTWARADIDNLRLLVSCTRNNTQTTTTTLFYIRGVDLTITYHEGSGGGTTVDTTPATFTISENYGSYNNTKPEWISDGSTSTTWRANASASSGKYVMWTFDKNIILKSFTYSSTQSSEYIRSGSYLQVSLDGNNWEDIGAFTGSTSQNFASINKECKYVRIYAKSGSGYVAITEATLIWDEIVTVTHTNLRVKISGEYKKVLKIYKKENGVYVEKTEQDISGLSNLKMIT